MAVGAEELRDVSASHKGVRFGPLAFGWVVGWRSRDHQATDVIGRFHPRTNGLQTVHHVFVEGVEFVRPVNRQHGKAAEVTFVVNGVKVKAQYIAFGRVHGVTKR